MVSLLVLWFVQAYGSIDRTFFVSAFDTRVAFLRPRSRLAFFFVRMWRFIAWPRLNLPVAVLWNRFAAPRCVFLLVAMFRGSFSMLLDRTEDLVHSVSHHLGTGFGVRPALEILDEPVEDLPPVVEARHLAAAELDGGLHLVA